MRRGAAEWARSGAAGARLLALVAASALAYACSVGGAPRRPEPPEPALRIWIPGLVHWSGGRRDIGIAVENGTNVTIQVEAPDPRRARVVLFSDSGSDRVCGQDPDATGPPDRAIPLAPGEARELHVDLTRACGGIPPGEYRYEAGYEAPAVAPGPVVRLRPRYGHVVVEAALPDERESLGSGRDAAEAGRAPARTHRTRR